MTEHRVALCLVDEANDFQQLIRSDAVAASKRSGLTLDVHFSGHDLAAQLGELRTMIDSSPRPAAILVLAVRDQGLARVARDAARAGVAFLFLNRTEDDLESLRREAPGIPIAAVCVDELETGRIQGRQFRALVPDARRVLYVQGSRRSLAARDRTAGMQEAVKGAPFEVVLLEAGWDAVAGREAVGKWLGIVARSGTRLDLVGCQNDPIAQGAIEALRQTASELGRPEIARIPVTGCDGTPSGGQRMVADGRLAATVVLPSPAGSAIDVVARYVRSKEVPPPLVPLRPTSYPEETALKPLPRAAG